MLAKWINFQSFGDMVVLAMGANFEKLRKRDHFSWCNPQNCTWLMSIILWLCWCAVLTHISVSTKSTLPGSERRIAATATAPLACGNSNTKKGGFNPYQYCTEGIYTISILSNLWLGGFKEFVFSSLSGMTFLVYDFFWSRHPTWSHPQYGNPGNLPGVFRCHIFVCWNLVVFTFSLR